LFGTFIKGEKVNMPNIARIVMVDAAVGSE
jgi:hypothetical protein